MNDARAAILSQLAASVVAVESDHPVRVAIDGVDGAGKTTIADELVPFVERLGRPVVRASIDGFHNPRSVRQRRSDDPARGYYMDSFDYAGVREALLDPLGPGGSRQFRRALFDFRTDSAVSLPVEEVPANAVLLFDGVFLLRPELRDCWDVTIFVHARLEVTLARVLTRDEALFGSSDAVLDRYRARYIPGQEIYLAEADPMARADIVVDNNDLEAPLIVRAR